ncbi:MULTISPECIES: nitrate/nitrite transporter NrtS [unclassified Vibrio]|uniref:nitrate/nitrite transporter NrtS n=1 Tax=unclassified Vibrio TaxID=2614977 RepID=UPI000B8E5BBA|nr:MULTISPECIES: nitrate/nitrite transporter NrtS [unclassified Vibrio]OXX43137.1 hypothetical protein B9J83_09755 [Vibrio sp. V07_P2A8T137]OXX56279.1 hypothetical protein B9J82_11015 [Vibrio sp. V10_P2A27P122]PSD40508.1 hypothetical protein C7E22_15710 [Vibrio sp. V02_P2A34T13]
MLRIIPVALRWSIIKTALKVSLVVGTLLNLINQGQALFDGAVIAWGQVLLNYLVPYCVSSYSAAKTQLDKGD